MFGPGVRIPISRVARDTPPSVPAAPEVAARIAGASRIRCRRLRERERCRQSRHRAWRTIGDTITKATAGDAREQRDALRETSPPTWMMVQWPLVHTRTGPTRPRKNFALRARAPTLAAQAKRRIRARPSALMLMRAQRVTRGLPKTSASWPATPARDTHIGIIGNDRTIQ